MKKILLAIILALTTTTVLADTFVRGYTRKDGTYVAPHWRSSPDSSYNNNWSVEGNRNPYTGKWGTQPRTYDDNYPNQWNRH